MYDLPLAEIIYDFYDKLKSSTRGLQDAELRAEGLTRRTDLVKLSDPRRTATRSTRSASITHREKADQRGRADPSRSSARRSPATCSRSRLQAAVGGRIIARESIRGAPQGRHGEVLRRRHHAEAQAPREAEGGQAPDAAGRQRRHPAEGLPERARVRVSGVRGRRCTGARSSRRSPRRRRRGSPDPQ